ncbi:MAG: hypothetical protein HQL75_06240 [Magnetococcales bacterium]|nr:hypothetical protein [Magnetococcales bacterium]MBF0605298.1 hypothetical protein [Magnetococcales bacterium]
MPVDELVPMSDDEFQKQYGYVFDDPEVDALVSWREVNTFEKTNESAYVAMAAQNRVFFAEKMKEVCSQIAESSR